VAIPKVAKEAAICAGGCGLIAFLPLTADADSIAFAADCHKFEGVPLRTHHWRETLAMPEVRALLAHLAEFCLLPVRERHGLIHNRQIEQLTLCELGGRLRRRRRRRRLRLRRRWLRLRWRRRRLWRWQWRRTCRFRLLRLMARVGIRAYEHARARKGESSIESEPRVASSGSAHTERRICRRLATRRWQHDVWVRSAGWRRWRSGMRRVPAGRAILAPCLPLDALEALALARRAIFFVIVAARRALASR
jgi:hypothetical protein